MSEINLIRNERADRDRPYGAAERAVLSLAAAREARREIGSWPGYAPTRLVGLPGLASELGVASATYKDEGERFGLGSFKALGGAYGVLRVLAEEVQREKGRLPTSAELLRGEHADAVARTTVTCATDGNHGRSVAWGASMFGCGCVIYLPAHVSRGREEAIAAYGAEVVRVAGSYDEAVRQADADAASEGRIVVSDTSYPGYEDIPRVVMQGYAVMVEEALVQLDGESPTHVFIQAGVGGVAAAIAAHLWERDGAARPTFVIVEPEGAACVFETVRAGEIRTFPGELHTVMGCLSCAEASPLAWRILEHAADFAATIPDALALDGMRLLAEGVAGDPAIVAGESAVAGLMAAREVARDPELRRRVGLSAESRLLFVGTEGATDPTIYAEIVGREPAEVLALASGATDT